MDPTDDLADTGDTLRDGASAEGRGALFARAQQLRLTLDARRDVEAMISGASRLRDGAAEQAAAALVGEAQQIAQALVLESQQWAEQLTAEAHERAEEILAEARDEAAATTREAHLLLAEAEAEHLDLVCARERSRTRVEDVEAALGRLRAELAPTGADVRRPAGVDVLFRDTTPERAVAAQPPATTSRTPSRTPAAPDEDARVTAEPAYPQPSLAELFPEPAQVAPRVAEALVVPHEEPEVVETAQSPSAEAPVARADVRDPRRARSAARAAEAVGSLQVQPDEERPAPAREASFRPLGWLFRTSGP